jgi:hypothetical protein
MKKKYLLIKKKLKIKSLKLKKFKKKNKKLFPFT